MPKYLKRIEQGATDEPISFRLNNWGWPVTTRRIVIRVAAIVVLALVGVTAVGTSYWRHLVPGGALPGNDASGKVLWRAHLFVRKATGSVPDLSWSELWKMVRRPGGFGLESLAAGRSAEGSLVNPYTTEKDNQAGGLIFSQKCGICHGADGSGWHGPPLNRAGLKHGDSDLSIYKVLRNGVPGTAMVAPDLTFEQRWQVAGYIRTLMIHGRSYDAAERAELSIHVSKEQILAAGDKTDEWLTYSGAVDGRRFTPLDQITPANVSKLRVRWIQQFNTRDPSMEATPIEVNGVMFTTEPPSNVVALDAKTGNILWRYDRAIPEDLLLCCGHYNRGVAVLGDTVFLGATDAYLVALDAVTGKVRWQTQVADGSDGYSITGAPLIANDSVIVGIAGAEFGIRGFLAAYDPVTGQQRWRFNTIPGPGEFGHATWESDAWKTGGGSTWVTGGYDPDLDLIYWGVGNPAPLFSADNRPGDNLFTNSVIALHGATGKLAWYFQFTPRDEHDWDSTQTPILTDLTIDGVKRKVLCWANRNGFYYVLDRTNGKFITGVPFVEQNWAKGLDVNGRPILAGPYISQAGRLTRPAYTGGTNWQNAALDRNLGLFFVPATEGASVFTKSTDFLPRDPAHRQFTASGASTPGVPTLVVRALDVATGARKWEYYAPPMEAHYYGGLLATGSGLVFGSHGGFAFALDSTTGKELWRVFLGGDTRAGPVSFALDGKQVLAISAGRALFLFGL
jgi:alcohol dehydrogenase (cytochrome c)